ncbi:hypothetical protein ACTXIP_06380 [Psychrobacter alimentarius]|uniref:hypothetical protein n=1 Tax=Psychrobacter alimentarius TaxID=261164 RepID=UPI003FD056F6
MESKNIYEDLISNICKKESLIDVGRIGTASQSSVSHLSKENDAQRAINGTVATDYSFHTGKEKSPWWQVEFESSINPHYIIINNRQHERWRKNSSSIEVSCINEKNETTIIHKGLVYFGVLPNSLPLILPLAGNIKVKKIIIKINQSEESYLHLSNISILVKGSLKLINKKAIFVTDRTDGFGERLRAILNTIVLARLYSSNFYFTWSDIGDKHRDFHAISSASEIFKETFIDEHLVNKEDLENLRLIKINKAKHIGLDNLVGYDGVSLDQGYLKESIQYRYSQAFNEIKFSEALDIAKADAKELKLPTKLVAIHLRAGDLVYGMFRYSNMYYSKAVPPYVAEVVINKFKNKGYKVLIFGQDYSFCNRLAENTGATYVDNIKNKNYTDTQSALFDITLMSRCNEIVAGLSGFAIVAKWIGAEVSIKKYTDCLTVSEIKNAFFTMYENKSIFSNREIDPLLKSFSLSHFLNAHGDEIGVEKQIETIMECLSYDPDNVYYKMLLALKLYENNEFGKGDIILLKELNKEINYSNNNIYMLIKKTNYLGTNFLDNYLLVLDKAMKTGKSVPAAVIKIWYDYHVLNYADIPFYKDYINKFSEDVSGISLVKEKINQITK